MTELVVELTDVFKQFKNVNALKNVSFSILKGEVIGLFGHNGAGKTTLMKLILGVLEPTRGNVSVFRETPSDKASWHIRKKIGFLPENVSFYEHLSGKAVLTYFSKLKGYRQSHAIKLLEQVGLTHAMHRPIKTYSKGMRQRLGLAQAFIGDPELLLLDEPTVGLDPIATEEFYLTLDELKKNGASIVICSHILPGVEKHIDKALIMAKGHVVANGDLPALRQRANLPIRMKISSLNLDQNLMRQLDALGHVEGDFLYVQPERKIEVLKQLIAGFDLTDIDVESVELSRLYQHYMGLADTSEVVA